MTQFTIFYWLGLIAEMLIRAPFSRAVKTNQKVVRRISRTEQNLLGLLTVGGVILPLIYSITPWLNFADYQLPVWAGWLGIVLLAGALFLFARGHFDLKKNWSPSLEIYQEHTLVTSGIYQTIRHPMYASQWLMVFAQIFLLWNWIAGPAGLVVFIPFYILRVRTEEKMMLETFGDQYAEYMKKVGGVIPKLNR